jgi:hypothetical protein
LDQLVIKAEVLKTHRAGGIEILMLRHAERGSYAIARDWTDWSLSEPIPAPDGRLSKLALETLSELTELVSELAVRQADDLDEASPMNHAQTS